MHMLPDGTVQTPWGAIPTRTMIAIQAYTTLHQRPSAFVSAVLRSDLFAAVLRAEPDNLAALPAIVHYLCTEAPCECCGSAQAVEDWLSQARNEDGVL